ncbi:glutamine amidotransferase-related protein [Echinicola jeungdonensis]|uniref:glutamine amidotransferase-related protein n=1 Tax=Echinicola jeungdonensis TaxID=709343 RepID=UPI00338F8145
MEHQSLPIIGIQFHPEAYLTEFGIDIICNWARVFANRNFPDQLLFLSCFGWGLLK